MTGTEQWLGSAPAHWTRGRLKDLIASSSNGTWGSDPVENDQNVRCIRAADFDRVSRRAELSNAPLRYVEPSSLRQHLLRPGDLVLEKSGGGEKQPVGMAVLFTGTDAAVCSNFCARIKPSVNVDSRFLNYVFAAAYGQGLTQAAIKQTTGIQNLDTGALLASRWAFPEKEEQCRIADFLDAETARIHQLMRARDAQVTALTKRDYASISEVLVPGSLANGTGTGTFPWLPELPESRPLVKLGYVCRIQNGLTVDGKRDVTGDVVTRPYLRVANVQAGHLTLDSVTEITVPRAVAERSTLRVGDVLMTEGGDLDKLGRGAVWNGELPECLHQNHVFALRPATTVLDGRYLALMTQTVHGRCYFESTGTRTTNLASTNSSKILGFPIPLPSLNVQRALVSQVHQELQKTATIRALLNQQLALMAERRQALITAAVTGQFDVSTASGRNVTEGVSA
ncbi:hypothetical protein ACPCAG_00280 [Streptomyces pseudogriseolus]|uniref:hypothetical protein n=1 Tax=Streptomyces pseudogriseolus TaxID=36817 RepID=UPI003FA2F31B